MLPSRHPARQAGARSAWPSRLRGIIFAALYGPGARFYDRFTDWLFLGEWTRWQRTALPLLPPTGLVVELGAGTGRLALAGARPGRRWVAAEPSASMLAAARQPRSPGAWMVRATAGALPLPDGAADAVVATFPTSYIVQRQTAAEIRRVLARNGRLVVVLDGALAPQGRGRRLRRAALGLFYATPGGGEATPFRIVGFRGETRAAATRHGTATVYVGVGTD
jgi:SAM-dependent methyltransferase